MNNFFPFLNWIGEVNSKTLARDTIAGITGAIIVLPQGVAFAMIAGLPPIYGLYTAIVLPIVAALFGSSKHLISGPTTAISIVMFSTVSQYADPATPEYVNIAITLTLLVGVIQLILGVARLGALINFVSHSVVIGFTAGAAILIASSQLKYVLGINIKSGATFYETWAEVFSRIDEVNFNVLGVALATLITAVLLKKLHKLMPNMAIAMVIGSILAAWIGTGHGIDTVGQLPKGLPRFSIPNLDTQMIKGLIPNAFAIALLGLIEAVAIARSIATKSGQRINGSQEFIGQGLSNIVGSFFSSYAGSGSFTRSGVNYAAGAQTPISAIIAALLLALIISLVAPLAAFLPIATMGGIILLVAYNLIDFAHFKKIIRTSKRETTVLLITLFATLILDLEYAIYMGVIFSLIFYLNQTSMPRFVELSFGFGSANRMFLNVKKYNLTTCPQLMIYRVEGSLFFGSIESVSEQLNKLFLREERHLLLVANNINLIDTSGAELLVTEAKKWRAQGKQIYFSGFKLRSRKFLKKGGFWAEIGGEYIFMNKEEAVNQIYNNLNSSICEKCDVQLFRECPKFREH